MLLLLQLIELIATGHLRDAKDHCFTLTQKLFFFKLFGFKLWSSLTLSFLYS